MTTANLDIERFRKLHAHIIGNENMGESGNARKMATKLATKAGMTYDEAVSAMNGATKQKCPSFFDGFEDAMEAKYPGYKADKAQKLSERERRYAQRRAEILEKFGTLKAFMDPTPEEVALLEAGRPFITKVCTYEDVCETIREYADEFAGIRGSIWDLEKVDPHAIGAIKAAIPFPSTVVMAFEELKRWDKLNRDRAHFYDHNEYYFDKPIELRVELLRDAIKNQPAGSWDDVDARIRYKAYDWEQQWLDPQSFNDPEWARLHADIINLRKAMNRIEIEPNPATVHHSNSRTRALILDLLDHNPDLADDEVSKRIGISPEAVGIWRRFHFSGDGDR